MFAFCRGVSLADRVDQPAGCEVVFGGTCKPNTPLSLRSDLHIIPYSKTVFRACLVSQAQIGT